MGDNVMMLDPIVTCAIAVVALITVGLAFIALVALVVRVHDWLESLGRN